MASRIKEDERNEKIIRGLLKLSANRRCINCNNLGPQYVCTNFWTFICTNCSGLHREFCHRVKSISMAKFTTQEVNALQEGGNERAKEIYFKEWDPQRHSLPDSSNIDSLRDFIKHVYVNRRFTGERNTERPPLGKADRTDSSERRVDSYGGDSRSPSYDDRYNDRLGTGGRNGDRNIRFIYGGRSPGYDQGDNKRSPRKIEVVDDRIRDDRYGIRRFEDRRLPDVVAKPEGSSPSRKKDVPSPPEVRPVRDILGDDMPQLRVGDTHKSKNTGVPASSSPAQTTSTSSVGSTDRNSVQSKTVNLGSLIDFTAEPEPSVTAAVPHQPTPQQITSPHSNGGDWASFDNVGQQKDSQTPANVGTLESALAQLSTSGPAPTPHMVATLPTGGIVATPRTNDVGQWPTTQQHQASIFPADLRQTTNLALNTTTAAGQSLGSSAVPTAQGPLPNSGRPFPQITGKPHQEMSTVVSPQPASVEAKSTGRKEIPADLFTVLYPSAHVAVSGWQRGPHPGIGYGMQYPMAMPQAIPSFPNSSKSTNPFDLGSEPVLSHAPMVPSMTSLQGLPHVTGPSPIVRSSSFGNPSPQWVPQPQSSMTSLQGLPHVTGPSPMLRSSSFENPSPQWVPQPHSSMTSLQGLPHVTGPSPLVRSSSFENPSSQWVPQPQSSFPNHSHPSPQWVPQPQSSFPPAMPQGPYMMQQVPGNMPQQQQFPVNTPQQQQLPGSMPQMLHNNMLMTGRQGTGGHGAAPPGNLGMDQLPTRRYPLPNTPSSFDSTGGNPFV